MSALTINGVQCPISIEGDAHLAPIIIGEKQRAHGGSLLETRTATKEAMRFRLPPMLPSDAAAWRGLLQGLGHSWGFDDATFPAYADGTGLGPVDTSSGFLSQALLGKWGARLKVTGWAGWNALPSANSWTVMTWRYSGAAWEHFIFTSDGRRYKNGAVTTDANRWLLVNPSDTHVAQGVGAVDLLSETNAWTPAGNPEDDTAWGLYNIQDSPGAIVTAEATYLLHGTDGNPYVFAVAAGSPGLASPFQDPSFYVGNMAPITYGATVQAVAGDPILQNAGRVRATGAADGYYDGLVCLPYVVPASWVADLYAEVSARAWTPNPRLRVDGDVVLDGPRLMRGELGEWTLSTGWVGGTYHNNLREGDFTLEER